jgi:putative oxygen-independent coproporphyrinogen III oxidase
MPHDRTPAPTGRASATIGVPSLAPAMSAPDPPARPTVAGRPAGRALPTGQSAGMPLVPPPLSLYVHLPWCVRKCPYCDFNSHEARGPLPFEAYVDALLADLDQDLPLVWGRTVHTVFFGGGTPSLFPADAIDRFLQQASARLRFAPDAEITLETNPGTAEHGRFGDYRRAGVNRISFGIQSFDDGCLQRLGRIHDGAQAEAAVKLAQDAGIDNLNLDLMYALPGQSLAMAGADVERAVALQPAHLSHYQLTLEPNTVFAARPPAGLPDEDLAWDMQEHCQAALAAAGYAQYEVSAYARPGRQCAHNLNYWRFGDYLGVGAGAHGKLTLGSEQAILRRWKLKHPAAWLAAAGSAAAIGGEERIAPQHRPFEFMLNALRLVDGFTGALFAARTGLPLEAIAGTLADAQTRGWLQREADRWWPTALGMRFGNDLIASFLHENDAGSTTAG